MHQARHRISSASAVGAARGHIFHVHAIPDANRIRDEGGDLLGRAARTLKSRAGPRGAGGAGKLEARGWGWAEG